MPEAASTIRLDKPTATQAPPCDLWPGDVLDGRYRLDAMLGWGGQAVVFQASDLRPGKRGPRGPLAVKIVRNDLPPDAHQEALVVLRWEAQLLRKLRHPALPRPIRFRSDNSQTWLARDLVTGKSLAEIATGGRCDTRTVRDWAVQICDLLSFLHTQSPPVICGDIKPSNLIVQPDGSLALIDLGAAQTRTQRPPKRARPQHGTPGYASPEQLGKRDPDERSDLFSLGVTCYELLTGEDPTAAPLQFDLQRLGLVAPLLAPALRWTLSLDPARRPPTAAVLRSALTRDATPEPLVLARGVKLINERDLLRVGVQHPQLLEKALLSGAVDRWLATHPDRTMGKLLHDLRTTRQNVVSRHHHHPLEVLFMTLAPEQGSNMLRAQPERIDFGAVPLQQWRVWSRPQRLIIHNTSTQPQCWELECPKHKETDVRVLVNERPVRRHSGVLAPQGRVEMDLVAAGRKGAQQGKLVLRCGAHTSAIDWECTATPMLPVGRQFITSLDDLDPTKPDVLPLLEDLLRRGLLQRWLRTQGERRLATLLAPATQKPPPDQTRLRLLTAYILHHRAPQHFPLIRLYNTTPVDLQVAAGSEAQHILEIENVSERPYYLMWDSQCSWAFVETSKAILPAQGRLACAVTLVPPTSLQAGTYTVDLELRAGDLVVPVSLPVEVLVENWWMRMFRWFTGT